ncbi:lateral flagellar basal body rod protein LfgB [Aeromonas jandaei]|uniref:lateral flagellar basal body rod protein LfgB n=1 Tax=Aeromonas TaxID=642 RepID=UPI00059E9A5C|nr:MULTISPECIES: lateral flagellar basal body rod protein LfgB [Aeromonas]KIQ80392.1 flagellar basal-body rod protein FlgB [Aeromonas sp. L_1B5_3]PPA29413.1 flagellar basal body rod protein FlgB [Aeromonas jandaei]QSR71451.1 lateral flagellar basal body rod protein LfgB [Aeromonas jandaei]QTL95420.1 Flagellar basal body rod protein FlgB [Aeromonas jandaei]QWL67461.1 lateral flagellar basal body rod protein LfgB [Aeromonas jandaei]
MSISFDSALGVHPYALDIRADRARILAGNLANVDTPGYLARDVDYKTILGRVAQQVAAGDESAAISQGTMADDMQHPLYRIPYQASMDGNTAELSVEQSKFANNATDFQTSLTFLNMKITGIAKAIEGR